MNTQATTTTCLRDGIALVRAGNRTDGYALLRLVTEQEPRNGLAWLWMASAVDDPHEAIVCLRRVLEISPQNSHATTALPEALVRAGSAAIKAGEKVQARTLLREATALAPKNENAWLWRAGVAETPEEGCECLQAVLTLNPNNARAKKGLAQFQLQLQEQLMAQSRPMWRCPLCEKAALKPEVVCSACRAVVSIDDPALFDKPTGADVELMRTAANRLYADLQKKPTPVAAYALGLAYLNLGHTDEGLNALWSAVNVRSADSKLAVAVERLNRRHQARVVKPAARPIVQIVDDSPTVRKLVATTLTNAGYQVVESGDGYEAAERVRLNGAPQLFLLDVNMPGMDGFELCKVLRGNPETAKVPIIFLTGKDGFFNKLRGQWAGAAEYLTKPFDPQRLLKAVAKQLPVMGG